MSVSFLILDYRSTIYNGLWLFLTSVLHDLLFSVSFVSILFSGKVSKNNRTEMLDYKKKTKTGDIDIDILTVSILSIFGTERIHFL